MADQKTANKYGATSGRLALIGVLAVVLVAAVYWNFFREPSRKTASKSTKDRVSSADSKNKNNSAMTPRTAHTQPPADHREHIRMQSWPEVELDKAIAYDPFAIPDTFPQPEEIIPEENTAGPPPDINDKELATKRQAAIAAQAAAIELLKSKGVQAIFRSDDNYIAIVDGREVRIGDVIEGYTVVHISTQGITLQGRNE